MLQKNQGIIEISPAQRLKAKAHLSLSPKLSSKLSPKAQVRLSSVVHYMIALGYRPIEGVFDKENMFFSPH